MSSNDAEWALCELNSAELGDARRSRRLNELCVAMSKFPGGSIPECTSNWGETKAFYRLLDCERLTDEVVLEAHRQSTLRRADESGEEVLLSLQDTTTLNFTNRHALEGRGQIGSTEKMSGLHLHNTLLLGAKSHRVFGLLGAKIYARDGGKRKRQAPGTRNREPLSQKESQRWVESFELTRECLDELNEGTRIISVGDREADIYELLAEAQEHRSQGIGLLIRAQHNRKLCESDQRLWDRLGSSPKQGLITVTIPRSRGLQQRNVELEVRYSQVELEVPAHKKKYLGLSQPVAMHAIELRSVDEKEEIRWRLVTTEDVDTLDDAQKMALWYSKRWQVEVLHRILKTGCKVENRQMRTMEKLRPMIALDLVIACYLMGMIGDARSTPEASATSWLEEDEIAAIKAYRKGIGKPLEKSEMNMEQAVRVIASLGGHLGRKNDSPPGAQVLWRGIKKLRTITEAWQIFGKH